jgi:uncharacterized protein
MRISVRLSPGSNHTHVGGRYGTANPPVLIVRVQARATDGKANVAVMEAIAGAFDVKRSAVRLFAGPAGRSKIFDVLGADPAVLSSLLAQSP